MANTQNGTRKRKRGRPMGKKDGEPRNSKRLIPPLEMVWLDKRYAAGHLGVSLSTINKNLADIGAVQVGDRRLIHRDRLDAWAQSKLPT